MGAATARLVEAHFPAFPRPDQRFASNRARPRAWRVDAANARHEPRRPGLRWRKPDAVAVNRVVDNGRDGRHDVVRLQDQISVLSGAWGV